MARAVKTPLVEWLKFAKRGDIRARWADAELAAVEAMVQAHAMTRGAVRCSRAGFTMADVFKKKAICMVHVGKTLPGTPERLVERMVMADFYHSIRSIQLDVVTGPISGRWDDVVTRPALLGRPTSAFIGDREMLIETEDNHRFSQLCANCDIRLVMTTGTKETPSLIREEGPLADTTKPLATVVRKAGEKLEVVRSVRPIPIRNRIARVLGMRERTVYGWRQVATLVTVA
jgi:hypothetical protein